MATSAMKPKPMNTAAALPGLLDRLARDGVVLAGIEIHQPTLDDVFLSLTGRELRDAA